MPNKQKTVNRDSAAVPSSWDTYTKPTGQYVYLASGSGTGRKPRRENYTRSWTTFPGWKAFRATNGYIPTQGCDELKELVIDSRAVSVYFYLGGTYRVNMKNIDPVYVPAPGGSVGFDSNGFYSSSELNDAVSDARQKCLAKARDMKVNISVMLGEGRQTVSMLAQTARTLGNAYRNFRRGRFRQAAKTLGIPTPSGTAANHWLAYNYGWRPLLSDAVGLLRLAEEGLITPGRGPRFSVSATSKLQKHTTTNIDGQGSAFLPGGKTILKSETVVKAKAALLLEFNKAHTGLSSVGLGRYDPLLTAWELTPFSFVFDWFVDVGGMLETLASLDGMTVLAGYSSTIESVHGTATMDIPGTGGWIDGVKPTAEYRWRSYKRVSWLGSALSLRTPLWDGYNARRLITTAALWRQRCRGDRVPGKYRP